MSQVQALRIARRLAVTAAVLAGLVFGVRACVSTFFFPCWDSTIDLPSPDSKHIAHWAAHYCSGPLAVAVDVVQSIEIVDTSSGTNAALKVFESYDDHTTMRWDDDTHLSIGIEALSSIALSSHEAQGVRVTYRVPRRLVTGAPQWADDSERRTEEAHRSGKMTDADYKTSKEIERSFRAWRESFTRWAEENAVVDESE